MKKSFFLFGFGLFLLISGIVQAGPGTERAEILTPEIKKLRQHLRFLSSDELKGRDTGSDELDIASRYISSRLRSWGLKPGMKDAEHGSYFQTVPLEKRKRNATISIRGGSGSSAQVDAPLFQRGYVSASEGQSEHALVFAGYGITDKDRGYDDYRNVDVEGKYVVIFRHEPNESDPDSKFDGTSWTKGATFRAKYQTAKKHGAAGVLLINDPLGEHKGFPDSVGSSSWGFAEQDKNRKKEDSFLPFVALSPEQGATLLGMSVSELRDVQKRIDRGPSPESYELPDRRATVSVTGESVRTTAARNVIARLPGSKTEQSDEHIVIGAHYDHLGTREKGEDRIYNGADDNASGTAAVLELARLFAMREQRPERTLIFVLFTAEERGLFGSRYYAAHPVLPLNDAVAMVNFDMVGRSDGSVSVYGASENVIFNRLNTVLDRRLPDTAFQAGNVPEAMSDHTPFTQKNVPVLFYFTGFHDNYHDVSDEVDQIHFAGLKDLVHHGAVMVQKLGSQDVKVREPDEETAQH